MKKTLIVSALLVVSIVSAWGICHRFETELFLWTKVKTAIRATVGKGDFVLTTWALDRNLPEFMVRHSFEKYSPGDEPTILETFLGSRPSVTSEYNPSTTPGIISATRTVISIPLWILFATIAGITVAFAIRQHRSRSTIILTRDDSEFSL